MVKSHRGFSLLELLITVLIIVLATAIGLPSFQRFVTENTVVTYTNEIVRTLNMARSESVKRGDIVTICKSAQTSPSCDSNRSWKDGWVSFVDINNNQTIDNGEEVIETHGGVSSEYNFTGNGNVANYIAYRPDGRSNTNGSFHICSDSSLAIVRSIVIANTGRIRSTDSNSYASVCS